MRIWYSVHVRPGVHEMQKVWRMETLIVFSLADVLLEPCLLHALTDQDSQKCLYCSSYQHAAVQLCCSYWQHFVWRLCLYFHGR